jgi:TolB-like protein
MPPEAVRARRRRQRILASVIIAGTLAAGVLAIVTDLPQKLGLQGLASRVGGQQTGKSARATIAVLPFSNQSGDAQRDYFSDGITEDVINALGRFSGTQVTAYNAVRPYKDRNPANEEIVRELGVRYIVQGSVRLLAARLRVSVQLSDARTGTLLWSDRYEDDIGKVFEIQDRIVTNIVGALAVKLTRLEQKRAIAKPTDSLEAYDLVLRARALLNRVERSANLEARALLEKAIQLAPQYAEAYVVLSTAEYYRAAFGWVEDMEEAVRRSESLAKRALALDDPGAHARAYASLAATYALSQRLDEALRAADRALELNPSDYLSYDTRGAVLLWLGKIEEAIAAKETALRFNPRPEPGSAVGFALAYYIAERHREALALADAVLARAPENVFLHAVRAASLAQLGEMEDARRAAERVRALSPFFQVEVFGSRFINPAHRTKIQAGLRKAGL